MIDIRYRIKVTSTIALQLTLNISETVRDRGLVPKDYQWEMTYGLSNGHVTDDVTWPPKVLRGSTVGYPLLQLGFLFSLVVVTPSLLSASAQPSVADWSRDRLRPQRFMTVDSDSVWDVAARSGLPVRVALSPREGPLWNFELSKMR